MRNRIRDLAQGVFSKHGSNPNVQSKYDLLVIDAPYFTKPVSADSSDVRLAFIIAKRQFSSAPWRVSTQSYTRRYHNGGGVSDGDFDHGKEVIVENDKDVLHAFLEFELDQLAQGFEKHERVKSSYVYGLPVDQALKFLDLRAADSKATPAP